MHRGSGLLEDLDLADAGAVDVGDDEVVEGRLVLVVVGGGGAVAGDAEAAVGLAAGDEAGVGRGGGDDPGDGAAGGAAAAGDDRGHPHRSVRDAGRGAP